MNKYIREKLNKILRDQPYEVNLSNGGLQSFPLELLSLKGITHLNLSKNNIIELPESIFELRNLEYLNVSYNNLIEIPEEPFSRLSKLRNLNIGNNNFIIFPNAICFLKNLEILDFENNQIIEIPRRLAKLPKLKSLFLNNNRIQKVPIEILKNQTHKSTFIALKNYFEALEKGTEELYEAKLILVGKGAVGKTSIANKIIDENYQLQKEDTTRGIQILEWSFNIPEKNKDFKISIWDFGGQQIYHGTHQFFLTKRSYYLLIWDARQEEDYITFDYWLNIIRLLSDNSPVCIVHNKADERTKEIEQKQLKEKFSNISNFFKVSCLNNSGINDLKNHIEKNILKLSHIGDELPSVWVEIRSALKKLNLNYISYAEYLDVCKSYSLDKEKADALSDYLHDLGSILHFSSDPVLKETIMLKPDWATKAVYLIVDSLEVANNFGRTSYPQMQEIWVSNDFKTKHAELLQLMKKFEICFSVTNEADEFYIIPKLLKVDEPDFLEFNGNNELKLEYHYVFMPAGIFTRLMVRLHNNILNEESFWRNGVVLKDKRSKTFALIENKPLDRKIILKISGEDKQGLLSIIKFNLDEIHDSLNAPEVNEMVSCVCSKCEIETPKMYSFDELKDALSHGKDTIECRSSWEDVDIKRMLYGLEDISSIPSLIRRQDRVPKLNDKAKILNHSLNIIRDNVENIANNKEEIEFLKIQLKVVVDELLEREEREKAFYIVHSYLNENVKDVTNSAIGGALIELGKIMIGA